jgi:hypothetical protein
MSEREAEAILRAGALAGEAAGWKVRALNAEAEVGRLRGQLHSLRGRSRLPDRRAARQGRPVQRRAPRGPAPRRQGEHGGGRLMQTCPYCGAQAENGWAEIAHMEAAHPEIIRQRLRAAGLPDEPPPMSRREVARRMVELVIESADGDADQALRVMQRMTAMLQEHESLEGATRALGMERAGMEERIDRVLAEARARKGAPLTWDEQSQLLFDAGAEWAEEHYRRD